MICLKGTTDFVIPGNCAVTIGKFDGIHRGHQALIGAVKKAAAAQGLFTVVFTFETSPRKVLEKEHEALMTAKEREVCLERMGIDYLIEYPFTDEVRQMSPTAFVEQVLIKKVHMTYLAVGEDFAFGYKRQGNCDLLKKLCRNFHFQLDIYSKLKYNIKDISSSYIRDEIRLGDIATAEKMLGRPYSFCGYVEHGKALGRTIGFPTLNLVPDVSKVLPPNGVYFTTVYVNGKGYWGVANLGVQPTVDVHRYLLEVHVLEFDQMIYGNFIWVDLHYFHRPEQKFDGLLALTKQLEADRADCIRFFEETRG